MEHLQKGQNMLAWGRLLCYPVGSSAWISYPSKWSSKLMTLLFTFLQASKKSKSELWDLDKNSKKLSAVFQSRNHTEATWCWINYIGNLWHGLRMRFFSSDSSIILPGYYIFPSPGYPLRPPRPLDTLWKRPKYCIPVGMLSCTETT